jgi:hypothetical protein
MSIVKNGRVATTEKIRCFTIVRYKVVEIHSKVVRTFPGSKDPRFESRSFYLHMFTSAVDWFIKGQMVCRLPAIHAPKDPWSHLKRGASPQSWASNSGRSPNHWTSS